MNTWFIHGISRGGGNWDYGPKTQKIKTLKNPKKIPFEGAPGWLYT
jgi:hypothetical protein